MPKQPSKDCSGGCWNEICTSGDSKRHDERNQFPAIATSPQRQFKKLQPGGTPQSAGPSSPCPLQTPVCFASEESYLVSRGHAWPGRSLPPRLESLEAGRALPARSTTTDSTPMFSPPVPQFLRDHVHDLQTPLGPNQPLMLSTEPPAFVITGFRGSLSPESSQGSCYADTLSGQ